MTMTHFLFFPGSRLTLVDPHTHPSKHTMLPTFSRSQQSPSSIKCHDSDWSDLGGDDSGSSSNSSEASSSDNNSDDSSDTSLIDYHAHRHKRQHIPTSFETELLVSANTSMYRRKGKGRQGQNSARIIHTDTTLEENKSHQAKRQRRKRLRHDNTFFDRCIMTLDRNVRLDRLHCISNRLFCACLAFWVIVVVVQQSATRKSGFSARRMRRNERVHVLTHEEIQNRLHHRMQKEETGIFNFWKDVAVGIADVVAPAPKTFPNLTQKKKAKEVDLPGCVHDDWQSFSFPTCNKVHETDLKDMFVQSQQRRILKRRFRNMWANNPSNNTNEHSTIHDGSPNVGYLSSGLWRSVWAVNPGLAKELGVLKSMKREHDVDKRNLDRHRRDALVMERFTSSPNVVDIYAYCGNAVLSEYIPTTIESLVNHRDKKFGFAKDSAFNQKIRDTADPIQATRETESGRLALALDIVRAIHDLHYKYPSGPIAHADIQTEQFLVASDGRVKINDFNRCRFMSHKQSNPSELCPFVIPSAPGKARSPEEYADQTLTQQIDVYSTANVLYYIMTGEHAWYGLSLEEVKQAIRKGGRPNTQDLARPGSSDAVIVSVIQKAYDPDPKKRVTAKQMLEELEKARPSEK